MGERASRFVQVILLQALRLEVADLLYQVQESTDLANWTNLANDLAADQGPAPDGIDFSEAPTTIDPDYNRPPPTYQPPRRRRFSASRCASSSAGSFAPTLLKNTFWPATSVVHSSGSTSITASKSSLLNPSPSRWKSS